jgi:UDP-N-acetyl-D-mannosaminuronic acid dehydrogenase
VLESTVPPRTTLDVLTPILARSGLRLSTMADEGSLERGLHVAHCPERVLPGRILEELVGNARVIGGVSRHAATLARDLYARFVQGEIILTDATTAELVKLAENTYRDVNIALANELALVAEQVGVDIWETIDLANHHPRVNILKPGPGVGGHCIAVDPWFIAQAAPDVTPLIQTARGVNDARPAQVVKMVRRAAGSLVRPTVACLGLTYKADVDDIRESPSIEVVRLLRHAGCTVQAYDPLVPLGTIEGQVPSLQAAVEGADVVVLLTDHSEFRHLPDAARAWLDRKALVDTRRALPPDGRVQTQVPARQGQP